MLASARIPLGAPGVYRLPDAAAPRLSPQRMDVCAFVGVAPRGPAYVPEVGDQYPGGYRTMADPARPRRRSVALAVRSFDEYRLAYGAFEGPGLLPYAVASFFEQGGKRAYVVRIVHRQTAAPAPGVPANLSGLSLGTIEHLCNVPLAFLARNAGSWGDALRIEMGFDSSPLGFASGALNSMLVDHAGDVTAGTLLLLTGALGVRQFAYCRALEEQRDPTGPASRWRLVFDGPLPLTPVRADIVEAWLTIRDGAGNEETFDRLGLNPDHPRALASVLCDESTLVWPHYEWAGTELLPASTAVELLRAPSGPFSGGEDGYQELIPDDFFDFEWSPAEEMPGSGITALAALGDATHVVVPDLYVPAQWAGDESERETRVDEAGAEFSTCVRSVQTISASATPPSALTGLILDPRRSADLAQIGALQSQIVTFCEQTADLVALMDVPPGLSQGQAERWRAGFDTSWCAAYHPWLKASRRAFSSEDERTDMLRPIPPSAVAAGIVAKKELERGIQFGPANEIAAEIVDLAETMPPGRADAYHPQGMNCFVREMDGIYLVSARTLSRDPQWRQLSVRRLILMLRRTLLRETQWAVFEPNGPKLWSDLTHAIVHLLRRLFLVGAFAGDTEEESFFVRVVNDMVRLDRGELLIEVGIAPVEPIEYIVLQLRRAGDGTLTLEE